jgi:hypothetical protein
MFGTKTGAYPSGLHYASVSHFNPSLILSGKASSLPSELSTVRGSTLIDYSLVYKYKTWVTETNTKPYYITEQLRP